MGDSSAKSLLHQKGQEKFNQSINGCSVIFSDLLIHILDTFLKINQSKIWKIHKSHNGTAKLSKNDATIEETHNLFEA